MTHKHSILTALTVLLIPLLFFANRVTAQTTTAEQIQQTEAVECKALDVVVLIDQSDSMRDTNDPDGNRFAAANTIIDYLGNHAVWLCAEQKVQHRITVVGYGDNPDQPVYQGEELKNNDYEADVKPYLENQLIPTELGDLPPALVFDQNWERERGEIKDKIASGIDDKLGATDHYSALLKAKNILDEWQQNPLPGGERIQAVIMITDGEPCLLARGCTKTAYDFLPDLVAIEDLTNPNDVNFPWREGNDSGNVYLSLITFSRRSGPFPEAFLRVWREITTQHGGDVYSANQRNTNLNAIVTTIVSGVAGSGLQPVPCNTDFWVQPYTDNLIILYAFSLADEIERAIISVELDDGETIQILAGQPSSNRLPKPFYIPDGRNEYYIFSSPLPGKYRVSLPGVDPTGQCEAEMEIGYEKSPVTAQVVTPTSTSLYPAVDPPNVFLGENFRVEVFQATEDVSGQNYLVEVPSGNYPLVITATVTSAAQTFQTSFPLVKVQDGIYESENLVPSPQPGTYTWQVVGTVRNADPAGQPIEVFRQSGGFTATEVNVFGFHIVEPPGGVNLALNMVQGNQQIPVKIPVAVEFIGANGQPLNVTSVLSETVNLFKASLMSDAVVHETIDLDLQTGSTSLFVGEFANNNAGHILATGNYTIQVEATWELDNFDALYYAPATTVRSVDFTQYEIAPLDLIIRTPGNLTLHKNDWRASLYGELQTFDFQVDVVNAISGDVMAFNRFSPIRQLLYKPLSFYLTAAHCSSRLNNHQIIRIFLYKTWVRIYPYQASTESEC